MVQFRRRLVVLWLALFLPAPAALAQEPESGEEPLPEGCVEEQMTIDDLPGVEWTRGPAKAPIGQRAEIDLPEGYRITDATGTRVLMEAMGNRPSPDELAVLMPEDNTDWFVLFSFDASGYVSDEEKDDLDADEILDSLRAGNEEANRWRISQGIAPIELVGWQTPPKYNASTHNLEWAVKGKTEGSFVINYNVRILGRSGVMTANLVLDPELLVGTLPTLQSLLRGYGYTQGNRYSEYKKGDKLAEYGLKGLIAGGALAVAAKTGLLQKFWKLIVVVVAGIAAAIKKMFGGGGGSRPSRRRPAA